MRDCRCSCRLVCKHVRCAFLCVSGVPCGTQCNGKAFDADILDLLPGQSLIIKLLQNVVSFPIDEELTSPEKVTEMYNGRVLSRNLQACMPCCREKVRAV